jgi:hypothetical protein
MRTENQDLIDIGGTRGTSDHVDGARQRSDVHCGDHHDASAGQEIERSRIVRSRGENQRAGLGDAAEDLARRSELMGVRRARCHFQRALLTPRQRREARIIAAACFHWQILRSQER